VGLSHGRKILVTDTVGFIRKLPPKLIASFRTTLAEVEQCDILLHVVDVHHSDIDEHIAVVEQTLEALEVHGKPVIMVFNKTDLVLSGERHIFEELKARYKHVVFISASKGVGITALKSEIEKVISESSSEMTVEVPLGHYEIASRLHELAEVKERKFGDTSVILKLSVHQRNLERVERLLALAA
jgi:GTP-binding protein HflX